MVLNGRRQDKLDLAVAQCRDMAASPDQVWADDGRNFMLFALELLVGLRHGVILWIKLHVYVTFIRCC